MSIRTRVGLLLSLIDHKQSVDARSFQARTYVLTKPLAAQITVLEKVSSEFGFGKLYRVTVHWYIDLGKGESDRKL